MAGAAVDGDGYVRIFVAGSVHLVRVKPGEMVDVEIVGNQVEVIRSDANMKLLGLR
jgi:hypothetical protein